MNIIAQDLLKLQYGDLSTPRCSRCKLYPENDAGFCCECADEVMIQSDPGLWDVLEQEIPIL